MASTKDLSHISPWLDLKKTFRGRGKLTAIFLAINLLLSGLIVGNAYEYFQYFMGRRRKIAVLNGIIIGIKECTLATFILMLVLFAFYYRFLRMLNSNKKDYENGVERSENATFGKAHFQDEDERKKNFKRYNSIADTSDEILGIDANGKYCCLKYPAGMNHNRLFCGAPGSGKTSAIIKTDIYQCIRRRQSIITTDSKGSLYAETSAVARANNYIVKVLNLKSDEIINSNAFNVMAPLNPNNTSFTAECQSIAEIIVNMTQAEDPMDYWAKQERQLLALAIMELASNENYIRQGQNNLYGVYQFLSSKTPDEMKEIFTRHPQGTPIRNFYNNFARAEARNQGQILNGLTGRLWMLNNPVFEQVLGHNEIDLILPMKKPCIYYVIIPDNDTTYNFIAALFFSMIFQKQSNYSDTLTRAEKKEQLEVYYELDEYKNWGGIHGLDTKASVVRSRKMHITIILQLLNQLYIVHGEDKGKEILNDCTVKGLLSTADPDTAKYFSELLGTFTAKTQGERYEEAKTDILHMHGTVNKNIGEQGVPLRLPESLMNDEMDRDEVIYVINSMAPASLKKCFAEMNGEPLHFMEAQGMEMGERPSRNYRPHWRKVLEEDGNNVVDIEPAKPDWYKEPDEPENGSDEVPDVEADNGDEGNDSDNTQAFPFSDDSEPAPKAQPVVKLTEVKAEKPKQKQEVSQAKKEQEKEKAKINSLLSVFGDDD